MALNSPLDGTSKHTAVMAYVEGLNLATQDWTQVYDVRRDDVGALKLSSVHILDDIPEWDGNDNLDDTDHKKTLTDANSKAIEYQGYAVSCEIPILVQKDLPGIVQQVSRKLGQMVAYKYNELAMSVFTNAFASETSGDGVALIHDNHKGMTSGSVATDRDNNATAEILSRSAIFSALKLMDAYKSFSGQYLDFSNGPLTLIVDPTKREAAIEILASDFSGADMETNAIKAGGFDISLIVSPYVNSDDWFVTTRQEGSKPLVFWERMEPTMQVLPGVTNLSLTLSTAFACKASPKAEAAGIVGSAV